MSDQTDLLFTPIADISARVRDGQLSPVEFARHCLDRPLLFQCHDPESG